jgi:hypothetical protein
MHVVFESLVPISKAPELIQIAEKTLRNWRSNGLYPEIFVKLGGKLFIDTAELAEIINTQKKRNKRISRGL